jgi:hypothetical protein
MLRSQADIRPADCALQHRPKVFDRFSMHPTLNVPLGMVDYMVNVVRKLQRVVRMGLIGIDSRTFRDVLEDFRQERFSAVIFGALYT